MTLGETRFLNKTVGLRSTLCFVWCNKGKSSTKRVRKVKTSKTISDSGTTPKPRPTIMQSFPFISLWDSLVSNGPRSSPRTGSTTTTTTTADGDFTAASSNGKKPSTLWIILVSSIIMNVIFIVRDNKNQQRHLIMVDSSQAPPAASSSSSQTVVYVRDNHIYLDPSRTTSSFNNNNNRNASSSSSYAPPTTNSSTTMNLITNSLSSSLSSSLVGTAAVDPVKHIGTTHPSSFTNARKNDNRNGDDDDGVNGDTKYLLTVPFYIYPEVLWDHLDNATMGKRRVDLMTDKHSDDYYFNYWATKHPMRTYNASEAQIFVVPFLENTYEKDFKNSKVSGNHICVNGRCSQQYMQHMVQSISKSPYLKKKPHIIVGSHCNGLFSPGKVKKPSGYEALLQHMYVIVFENVAKGKKISIRKKLQKARFQQDGSQELDSSTGITHYYRRGLPTTYVGRGCTFDPTSNPASRTYDVAFISKIQTPAPDRKFVYTALTGIDVKTNNTKTQMNQYDWMKYVVNRRKVPWDKNYPLIPMPQCPSLADARYGFHVAGDSPTSDRLLATILSGTIPIFTRQLQLDMVPDWVDWNAISVFIDLGRIKNNQELFLQELRAIIEDEEGYQRRYQALIENMKLFDWVNTMNPFDMYMYRIQAEEYPETRHVDPTKIWSILPNHMLPPARPQRKK